MRKKIEYTDEPVQIGERVADFLPSPAELAEMQETAKITINLSRSSIAFFKRESQKTGIPYQKRIRSIVDLYVRTHASSRSGNRSL